MDQKIIKFNQIVSHLRLLGYPGVDDLKYCELEWLMDNEMFIDMFERIMDRTDERNVLNEEQKKALMEMEKGEFPLDAKKLEEALAHLEAKKKRETALKIEREQVKALEVNLEQQKKKLEELVLKKDKLRNLEQQTDSEIEKWNKILLKERRECERSFEKASLAANKTGEMIKEVALEANKLLSVLAEIGKEDEVPIYFSQLDMEEFIQENKEFNKNLATYLKKQFDEEIGDVLGHIDRNYYPELSFVRGRDSEEYMQICKEFAILQESIPEGKIMEVHSMMENVALEAKLNRGKAIKREISEGIYPVHPSLLSKNEEEAICRTKIVNEKIQTLLKGLETMIKDLTRLDFREILSEDYKVKLMRKKYFLSKQQQLIKWLISQKALLELHCDVLFCEFDNIKKTDRLLKNLSAELGSDFQKLQLCHAKLTEVNVTDSHSQEQASAVTSDSLDDSNWTSSRILCKTELENKGSDLEMLFKQNMTYVTSIKTHMDQLMKAVFKKRVRVGDPRLKKVGLKPSSSDDFSLSPVTGTFIFRPFHTALEAKAAIFRDFYMGKISEIKSNQMKIKSSGLRRKLFIYFFSDKEKFRRMVRQHQRLQAIKDS